MILRILSHAELAALPPAKLRKRIRECREQLVDRAGDVFNGRPDYPTARANLDRAVMMLMDADSAAERRGLPIPRY